MKKLLSIAFICLSMAASAQQVQKVQCKGTTAKNGQCSRLVDPKVGYCFQHNPDTKKCAGTTKKGEPCKSPAKKGSDYCFRHQPQ